MSPSCPSFPTPFERILIFSKDNKKLQHQGETDLTKQEFINYANSLWTFSPEKNMEKYGHPAVFPEELPKRLIKMNSYIGDTVLDPFSGSGTTCLVAKFLKRKYIGFEIDKKYYDLSKKRLSLSNQMILF